MTWTTPPCLSPRRAAAAGPPTTSTCCARRWTRPGYRPDPGDQPELFRPGERQRLPADACRCCARPWPRSCYGDMLMLLAQPGAPLRGRARARPTAMVDDWIQRLAAAVRAGKGCSGEEMMARIWTTLPRTLPPSPSPVTPKVQGGRRGRNLCQILARWATTTWKSFLYRRGLRGQRARPDGLCACTAWTTPAEDIDLYGGNPSRLVVGGC